MCHYQGCLFTCCLLQQDINSQYIDYIWSVLVFHIEAIYVKHIVSKCAIKCFEWCTHLLCFIQKILNKHVLKGHILEIIFLWKWWSCDNRNNRKRFIIWFIVQNNERGIVVSISRRISIMGLPEIINNLHRDKSSIQMVVIFRKPFLNSFVGC